MLQRFAQLFSDLGWLVVILILLSPRMPRWVSVLLIVIACISIVGATLNMAQKLKR